MVRLLAVLFRSEIVGIFEINGIDGAQGNEFQDLHGIGLCRLQLVQLVLVDPNILLLGYLIPLHEFIIIDVALADRTKPLLLDAASTWSMQLVEMDVLFVRSEERRVGKSVALGVRRYSI